MYGGLGTFLAGIEPPLWTGLLAGFIREKGFSVKIIDADAEGWTSEYAAEKIIEYNPLLVGIGLIGANPSASSTPKMPAASKILNIIKEKRLSIKTILYGIHPSALPERTLREEGIDFISRGESFYTVLKLLKVLKSNSEVNNHQIKGLWYIKDNTVVSNGWGELVQDLDELPSVAWDLLPMDKYRAHNWHCFEHIDQRQPYAVIYTSLGCPFNCSYCNIHALYNGRPGIRFRSPKKVVDEIDFLVKNYNIKNIKIIDELFAIKGNRVIELCDLIIERDYDLNMWAYARIDTVNERLLSRMKQAGINWLCYGIEGGSQGVREGVSKGRFGQEEIKRAIEMTHKAGIYVLGNFMFGLPDDDLETMRETLELAMELNCEYVNFYTTMAYPGSKLHEEVNLRDLPNSWIGYSQFSYETQPLPTKYLRPAEILRFRDYAFNKFYSNERYQNMILEKFGKEVADHIKNMLNYQIRRKLLTSKDITAV